jgi:hypothetical protein
MMLTRSDLNLEPTSDQMATVMGQWTYPVRSTATILTRWW